MANFFNLPPPWNPGYALPQYVADEGLERHAYVTKMLPRGTYDRSTDGSAGYAIPQYVLEERTGRGTYTTKWLPRGYYGPGIPHYLNRHPIGLGDTEGGGGNAFSSYGAQSARVMLSSVQNLPAAQRAPMLRKIMDTVDPALAGRVEVETKRAAARGVPANRALEAGIAAAMTNGILGELAQLGRTRKAPARRSLLGLGIWGLGADSIGPGSTVSSTTTAPKRQGVSKAGLFTTVAVSGGGTASTVPCKPPANASCPAGQIAVCNPPTGMTWDEGTKSFQRNPVGIAPIPMPGVGYICKPAPPQQVQVGPFKFDAKQTKNVLFVLRDAAQIPADWKPFIKAALLRGAGDTGPLRPNVSSKQNYTIGTDGKYIWRNPNEVWKDECYWLSALGIKCKEVTGEVQDPTSPIGAPTWRTQRNPGLVQTVSEGDPIGREMLAWTHLNQADFDDSSTQIAPIAKFKHPVSGNDWGVFFTLSGAKSGNIGPDNPYELGLYFAYIPKKHWYQKVWDAITWLPSKMADVVEETLDAIGDLACKALSTPGAAAGAAAATGGVAGIGVVVAAGMCGPAALPQFQLQPEQPSMLMPILLIGGGLAAVLLLTGKKKPKTETKP